MISTSKASLAFIILVLTFWGQNPGYINANIPTHELRGNVLQQMNKEVNLSLADVSLTDL